MKYFLGTISLTMLLAAAAPVGAVRNVRNEILAAVADTSRPDADRVQDTRRKPAETLAFAGVRAGMVVAELGSGGGYYTRLLADAVGPKGRVLAIVTAAQAARPNGLSALNGITESHPNVVIVNVADYASMELATPADLFWTTENYHDFHNGPTANVAALNKAVLNNLKRGGVFYVEDHSAAPGAGLEATPTLHRMNEDLAKKELTAAGFKLVAESDLLRNRADNRVGSNSEAGHFVTDRFMLRLRK